MINFNKGIKKALAAVWLFIGVWGFLTLWFVSKEAEGVTFLACAGAALVVMLVFGSLVWAFIYLVD